MEAVCQNRMWLISTTAIQPTTWHRLLLLTVGGLVFGVNLGSTHLWDVDESIFSATAREMLERGDWITPWYNGQLFAHKPPLLYWCQMLAFRVLGLHELAARLFPAMFSVGTLLLVYELGRRLFNPRTGLWAGLVLAGSLNFAMISRAATPDALLTFFCTLSLLIFVSQQASPSPLPPTANPNPWQAQLVMSRKTAALAYATLAVGVLVKGPVALILPMAVWGMFLLIERRHHTSPASNLAPTAAEAAPAVWWQRLRDASSALRHWFAPRHFLTTLWSMRPLTAVALVLLLAGPWYLAVGYRTDGQFLREFFWTHNFARAASPMEHHSGSLLFYPATLCIGMFPWSVLLWPALNHVRQGTNADHPHRAAYVLIACWILVWVGCFSIVATKLANYVVPAYLGIALAVGSLIDGWLQRETSTSTRRWLQVGWLLLASVGCVCLIAVPLVTHLLFDGEITPALAGLIPLVGAGLGWHYTRQRRLTAACVTLAGVALTFSVGVLGLAAIPIDAHKNTHRIGAIIRQHSPGNVHLATYKYSPPSLVFYTGLKFDRLRSRAAVLDHFRQHRADCYLLTTERHYATLCRDLPPDVTILVRDRMFLKQEHLVLLTSQQTKTLEPRRRQSQLLAAGAAN